jgi:hypothetical protein
MVPATRRWDDGAIEVSSFAHDLAREARSFSGSCRGSSRAWNSEFHEHRSKTTSYGSICEFTPARDRRRRRFNFRPEKGEKKSQARAKEIGAVEAAEQSSSQETREIGQSKECTAAKAQAQSSASEVTQ